MKLPALSFTTAASLFLIGTVSAGCPFAHLHNSGGGNGDDASHGGNPHHKAGLTQRDLLAANQHSLNIHQTPLVHFKIPPIDRHASNVQMEGGVLVEKKKKKETTATASSEKKEDNNTDTKAEDHTVRSGHHKQRKLQQEGDTIFYSGEYASADPSYSNQNVGDGYAIPEGGYGAVRQSVIDLVLTQNKDYWAADFADTPRGLGSVIGTTGNYGGLFIRLAWHCNGTYRMSDGRGGCDGGSIRFSPVANWADNASLNMALALLQPIKELYGEKLSWGDLIVLASDAALNEMGFPTIGFCGGRIDWSNGDQNLPLGPSVIQQQLMPCGKTQCPEGELCPDCVIPLGTAAVGLIYVEPVGTPEGDFVGTAQNIREVFARMGFNDRMTVASIGGGHAFGKSHGPCHAEDQIEVCQAPPEAASASLCEHFCPHPDTNSTAPPYTWLQKTTSGLEVTWTRHPTVWDNEFFTNLFDYTWESYEGPGGHLQWRPEFNKDVQMFTTDLALAYGDPAYEALSREYANSLTNLTRDFGTAWYQLMSRDVGPRARCLGDEVPPLLQPWEETMGPVERIRTTTDDKQPDYIPVRAAIQQLIDEEPSMIAALATLARQCASTFRSSDYQGGCNGAAIRFSPSLDWPTNAGAADSLQLLETIKETFPEVSWSDLIVLAGHTAIEAAGGRPMPFCGGRADAENGSKSEGLEPRIYNNQTYASVLYDIANKGMSLAEGVALMATPDPNYFQLDSSSSSSSSTASVRAATVTDNSSDNGGSSDNDNDGGSSDVSSDNGGSKCKGDDAEIKLTEKGPRTCAKILSKEWCDEEVQNKDGKTAKKFCTSCGCNDGGNSNSNDGGNGNSNDAGNSNSNDGDNGNSNDGGNGDSNDGGNSNSNDGGSSAYTLSNQFFVRMKELSRDDETSEQQPEWFTDDLASVAEQFINDNDYFLEQYAKAYTYLMTADLFDGPTRNACQDVNDLTLVGQTPTPTSSPPDGSEDSDSSNSNSDSDSDSSTTTDEDDTVTPDNSGNSTTNTTNTTSSAATALTNNSNSHIATSIFSAVVAFLVAVYY